MLKEAADKSFEDAVKGKKFKHPETGNDVAFGSLPGEEQKKLRAEWSKKNEKEPAGGAQGPKETASKILKGMDGTHRTKFRPSAEHRKELESAVGELESAGVKLTDEDISGITDGNDDSLNEMEKKLKGKPGWKKLDKVLNDIFDAWSGDARD